MQVKHPSADYVPSTPFLASLFQMKSQQQSHAASTGKKAIRIHVDNMILFRSRGGAFTKHGNEAQDYQPCQITDELLRITETAAKLRFGSEDVKKVVVCEHTWEVEEHA